MAEVFQFHDQSRVAAAARAVERRQARLLADITSKSGRAAAPVTYRRTEEIVDANIEILQERVRERERPFGWNDYGAGPKHVDCEYFGIYQADMQCSPENVQTYMLPADVYTRAQMTLRRLLRASPDTYSHERSNGQGIDLEWRDGITFRARNRLRWAMKVAELVSLAHWATNIRAGFMYVAEERTNAVGELLNTWGPTRARRLVGDWWTAVSSRGGELFLPWPWLSFFRYGDDPALNPPWFVMATGRDTDSQRWAEKRRGQRRRAKRKYSEDAGVAEKEWWKWIGGDGLANLRRPNNVWKLPFEDRTATNYWPSLTVLHRLMMLRGGRFVPLRTLGVQKADPNVFVPTGDLLLDYVRAWAEPVAATPYPQFLLTQFEAVYTQYLKRFDPTTFGMTLKQIDDLQKKTATNKALGVTASITAFVGGIAGAAFWLAGLIVAIVGALAAFFTWLFGGAYRGCPKAPRPFVLRTLLDRACNQDLDTDRTVEESLLTLETAGARGGVAFKFPRPAEPGEQDPLIVLELPDLPGLPPLPPYIEPPGGSSDTGLAGLAGVALLALGGFALAKLL